MSRQILGLILAFGSICGAACSSSTSTSSAPVAGAKAGSSTASTPVADMASTSPQGATGVGGAIGGGGQFQPPSFPPGQNPAGTIGGLPIPGAGGPPIPGLPEPAPSAEAPTNPAGVPGAAPPTESVVAQAGVGLKGRSLDQHEGFIVTPAKTLFTAREKIAFEIAIPHALNLYKASTGFGPKSHDEFMQKIVVENQIKLPQLPAGHRYVYDPETEQLMVERPKK